MPKKKVVAILKVPPPVHGSTLMNKYVWESQHIASELDMRYLPVRYSANMQEVGTVSAGKLRVYARFSWQLARLLAFERPALLYFAISPRGAAFLKDAWWALLAQGLNIPILFHLQGQGMAQPAKGPWGWLYRQVFRRQSVVCLSPFTVADTDFADLKRVFVIPNTGGNAIAPITRNWQDEPVFTFLGNFIETKGILDFLEAAILVLQQGGKLRLAFAGADTDVAAQQIKKRLADVNLSHVLHHIGPAYGPDKAALLATSQVLVFPSRYPNEASPLVIMEALQHGLPVVGTHWAGIPDMIDDGVNGYLCPPGDIPAIAQSIAKLAASAELRQTMGAASYQKYNSTFTLAHFEERLATAMLEA